MPKLTDQLFNDYEELIDQAMNLPAGDTRAKAYQILHDVRVDIISLDILSEKGQQDTDKEKLVINRLNKAKRIIGE